MLCSLSVALLHFFSLYTLSRVFLFSPYLESEHVYVSLSRFFAQQRNTELKSFGAGHLRRYTFVARYVFDFVTHPAGGQDAEKRS